MIKVNVGLERKLARGHGRRQRWESRNILGVEFPGDWQGQEAHARFRAEIHRLNPGWHVQGYAIAADQ